MNKLQLEMENMNKQHKEAVDIYKKDIETRQVNENKLNEQVRGVNFYCNYLFFYLKCFYEALLTRVLALTFQSYQHK